MFYSKKALLRVSISSLFLVGFSNLQAAEDMPVIVVTPDAVEKPRNQSSTPITVIDRETIENSNADNVAELLRGQVGLQIRDLFGDGTQAAIDIRGFGPTAGSNTLILLDGRRLNHSSDNAIPDISTIDVESIEQIEILQGSAGVLYGHQAVGGVINIIRKKVVSDKAYVKFTTGSYATRDLTASVDKLSGQSQWQLNANHKESDNYRDHNDIEKQSVSFRLNRQHSSFSSYLELEARDEKILTPGALLESELDMDRKQSLSFYQNDFFDTESELFRVGINKHLGSDNKINVDISRRVADREFVQTFRPSLGTLSTQDRDTRTFSIKYQDQISLDNKTLNLISGVDYETTDYKLVSILGPQAIDQSIQSLYLSADMDVFENSYLQAGIRYSDQNADIADDNFKDSISVFSLSYNWQKDNLKLFARADQNFRFPTVEEHTNVPFGDPPGLKTQEGVSVELGAELVRNQSRYRVTVYDIKLDNEIAFDSSGFSNLNLDETSRQGLVFEYLTDWSEKLSSSLSMTLLDAEISDGFFVGNDLPLVAERALRLDAYYRITDQISSTVELIHVDDQITGGDFANQLDKIKAYEVVNGSVSYKTGNMDWSFRINNILDEKYSETGSQFTDYSAFPVVTNYEAFFPAPERNFWVSLKYTFQ